MNRTNRRISRKAAQAVLVALFFAVVASLFLPVSRADSEKYEVTVQRNVEAKMRDGVTLRADIYRPKADGKFPVLLVRTPYDKQWFNESWSSGLALDTMRRRAEKGMNALEGSKVLPLVSYPVLEAPSAAGIAPYFTGWLAHPNYDNYWKPISIEDHYADIQVPV